ncbi:helix-turn-helix transcriptional regulator [Paenilisteria rocourtiae]|uniref:CBS domain protein n=1 Tax=Listeria rocourtiae TaxID=647910 RepID=A0A4R6ZSP3_9LIST|nr:helix-turn-helix transcriptional regulator [Listeria rocourtiae]MBC1435852.1 helix-turn-helix transcriptional regulator [Listeria rocourtiae]MBC1603461.1 helix-turn-helix transcriptional regulator [Listeria rocourtiae]TDR55254.1 CBS domain protein [Listeria rocourtiae]
MSQIKLSARQLAIIEFVKEHEPATGDQIARSLELTRATIRADLSILTMTGILDARPKVGYFYSGLDLNPTIYEDIRQLQVEAIMTTPVFVTKETSIHDAIVTLFLEDTGSLYVIESSALIGIVSRKDLLKGALADTDKKATPIATIMTRMPNILTVTKNDTALYAAQQLVIHQIDSLPVMDAEKAIGKVSKTRLVQLFVDTFKNE